MKINLKVRLKNPTFWLGIIATVVATVSAYIGVNFEQLTTWHEFFDALLSAISNPVVVVSTISAVYNAIIDPTTSGLCDSKEALTYNKPKE